MQVAEVEPAGHPVRGDYARSFKSIQQPTPPALQPHPPRQGWSAPKTPKRRPGTKPPAAQGSLSFRPASQAAGAPHLCEGAILQYVAGAPYLCKGAFHHTTLNSPTGSLIKSQSPHPRWIVGGGREVQLVLKQQNAPATPTLWDFRTTPCYNMRIRDLQHPPSRGGDHYRTHGAALQRWCDTDALNSSEQRAYQRLSIRSTICRLGESARNRSAVFDGLGVC